MSEVAQTAEQSPEITPSEEKKEGLFSSMFKGISAVSKSIRESLGKALDWSKKMLEKGIEQLFPELKEMKEAVTKSETKPPPDATEKPEENAETNTEEEDSKPTNKAEKKPSQGESTEDKDKNNKKSESPKKGKGTEAKSPKKENPKGAETSTKATNPKKKAA